MDQCTQPGMHHSFFLAQVASKGLATFFASSQIEELQGAFESFNASKVSTGEGWFFTSPAGGCIGNGNLLLSISKPVPERQRDSDVFDGLMLNQRHPFCMLLPAPGLRAGWLLNSNPQQANFSSHRIPILVDFF